MCRSLGNAWRDPPSSIYKGNVVGKLFGIGRSSIALASASYTRLSLGWCSVSHPQFVLEMFSMNTECAGEFDFPSGWWRVHRMSPRFSLLLINRCSSIWRRDDTRNTPPKWKVFASQRITKRSATSTLFPCPKAWFFSLSHFLSLSLSLSPLSRCFYFPPSVVSFPPVSLFSPHVYLLVLPCVSDSPFSLFLYPLKAHRWIPMSFDILGSVR